MSQFDCQIGTRMGACRLPKPSGHFARGPNLTFWHQSIVLRLWTCSFGSKGVDRKSQWGEWIMDGLGWVRWVRSKIGSNFMRLELESNRFRVLFVIWNPCQNRSSSDFFWFSGLKKEIWSQDSGSCVGSLVSWISFIPPFQTILRMHSTWVELEVTTTRTSSCVTCPQWKTHSELDTLDDGWAFFFFLDVFRRFLWHLPPSSFRKPLEITKYSWMFTLWKDWRDPFSRKFRRF